ncbi:MAG: hypothetical protein IJI37_02170, partial [Opitutales bacterium]|nr:hypothetical protein [Opitutales bacterium]
FQAYAVAREYILARSLGVDRIYKYSLRDDGAGHTREGNFGIIGRDYRLKPAFFAYQTLARELGNARPKLSVFGDIHVAEWTRPDGVPACAVWKMRKSADVAFSFGGALQGEQINFLGAAAPAAATDGKILKLRASESGIYLKGVKNLRLAE